jgi:hypothetical protein
MSEAGNLANMSVKLGGYDAYSQVDDKNGNVTQRGSTRTQIGERLVAWSVDDEQSWNLDLVAVLLVRWLPSTETHYIPR